MSLNAKLVVVGGDVKTTEIKLRLPSTIGRGRGTTIVLPHPLVSRQHCELFESDGKLMVRDLGSLNGTFVNNERITESPLEPGELLTVGTVTFRAVYESEAFPAAGSAPTVKAVAGEKTVQVTKATTIKAPSKPAPPESATPDSEPLDFNFEQPLLPVDQESRPTERSGPAPAAARADATVAAKPAQSADSKGVQGPAAGGKRPPADPPDTKSDSAKAKPHDSEADDDQVASTSDEDLNDFLDSLGNK